MRPDDFRLIRVFWLGLSWVTFTLGTEVRADDDFKIEPLPAQVPSPADNPVTAAKVALGKQLFFDPRLSGDNKMSCASCHMPEKAFADGKKTSEGADGKPLPRNSQSVLNVAFLKPLFWDGRAANLEQQALVPITSEVEMNQNLDELEKELNRVPGYKKQFQAIFQTSVTRDGIAKALAAFQRTLTTGPSPVDRYLKGEKKALTKIERRGLELFTGRAGCVRCHHGPLLSDGKFHRVKYSKDSGRETITSKPADRHKFRTPSLRNVAGTAPYMHNGSLKSLKDVVTYYYREAPDRTPDGLPLDVEQLIGESFSDILPLVAFLEALSGEIPDVKPPTLPQ